MSLNRLLALVLTLVSSSVLAACWYAQGEELLVKAPVAAYAGGDMLLAESAPDGPHQQLEPKPVSVAEINDGTDRARDLEAQVIASPVFKAECPAASERVIQVARIAQVAQVGATLRDGLPKDTGELLEVLMTNDFQAQLLLEDVSEACHTSLMIRHCTEAGNGSIRCEARVIEATCEESIFTEQLAKPAKAKNPKHKKKSARCQRVEFSEEATPLDKPGMGVQMRTKFGPARMQAGGSVQPEDFDISKVFMLKAPNISGVTSGVTSGVNWEDLEDLPFQALSLEGLSIEARSFDDGELTLLSLEFSAG